MILLYIHLVISGLTFILFNFAVFDAVIQFKRRHPDYKSTNNSVVSFIGAVFRLILQCVIPIYNIFILFVILFNHEQIVEKTINNLELKKHLERKD